MSLALHYELQPAPELSARVRHEMYALFARCYDCVSREAFDQDLAGKDHVILLRDAEGAIRGFSTQRVFPWKDARVLYSGDTIVDPACWGSPELVKGWCRVAANALRQHPGQPLYWLLLSKGYRTYLYMPLFFREFLPSFRQAPAEWLPLRDALGSHLFGGDYDAARGVVAFAQSRGQLKPDLAGIPPGRASHEDVRFFLQANPGYARGEELVCLTRICLTNTHGPGRRWLEKALTTAPPEP